MTEIVLTGTLSLNSFLILFSMFQLKDFLKKCKVGNFTKQFKQIVEKVEENCKFITNRRRTTTIALSDIKAIVSVMEIHFIFNGLFED